MLRESLTLNILYISYTAPKLQSYWRIRKQFSCNRLDLGNKWQSRKALTFATLNFRMEQYVISTLKFGMILKINGNLRNGRLNNKPKENYNPISGDMDSWQLSQKLFPRVPYQTTKGTLETVFIWLNFQEQRIIPASKTHVFYANSLLYNIT